MTALAVAEVDQRDPVLRLEKLFDAGTLELLRPRDDSGVVAARGRIGGNPAVSYCTDATVMGGAMGWVGCQHIVDAIDIAVRERVPVIGLWHSGGARLAEGVEALHAVGLVFQAMIRASGRVPHHLGRARARRGRRRLRAGPHRHRDHGERRPGVRHRPGRRAVRHRRERRHGVPRRPGHTRAP